jgi:hypothetical protein
MSTTEVTLAVSLWDKIRKRLIPSLLVQVRIDISKFIPALANPHASINCNDGNPSTQLYTSLLASLLVTYLNNPKKHGHFKTSNVSVSDTPGTLLHECPHFFGKKYLFKKKIL